MAIESIVIEELRQKSVEEQTAEVVERKGLGHPDYIADNISELACRSLCQNYLNRLGSVLHHNLDKVLVVGGRAEPTFGGGTVKEPIQVLVCGRATIEVEKGGKNIKIPYKEEIDRAINHFFTQRFRFLNPGEHISTEYRVRAGSKDLVGIFELGKDMPLSNDTSIGVGYAPLTPTENVVLETERYLNSTELKRSIPECGEDVKVLGYRNGRRLKLSVNAAIISSLTRDMDHYLSVKEEIAQRVQDLSTRLCDLDVTVEINPADEIARRIIYLTVTGTSAEAGDDGATGRGNRANGLITPCRPMTMEAAAGKNPVNHVGKIYSILATQLANRAAKELTGVKEIQIKIIGQIGKPINRPLAVTSQINLEERVKPGSVKSDLESIIVEGLAKIKDVTALCLTGNPIMF